MLIELGIIKRLTVYKAINRESGEPNARVTKLVYKQRGCKAHEAMENSRTTLLRTPISAKVGIPIYVRRKLWECSGLDLF